MRNVVLGGLVLVAGCDDVIYGQAPAPPLSQTGWPGVEEVFDTYCLDCHSAEAAFGQLDLETNPYGAIVGVASSNGTMPLVDPSNPDNSLLYLKLVDQQPTGSKMPPASTLSTEASDIVRDWIADGAPQE